MSQAAAAGDRKTQRREETWPVGYLEPPEQRTRGAAVLGALADKVERAGLEIGGCLPPELCLAEQLGVGVSTISKALNRWDGLDMIRRKRGDGTCFCARMQMRTARRQPRSGRRMRHCSA